MTFMSLMPKLLLHYSDVKLRIVTMTANTCWKNFKLDARLIIIAGTECHEEGVAPTRRKEYRRSDLMKMMFGMWDSSSSVGTRVIVIMTDHITKKFYKNQCLDSAAVESQLPFLLADHLNSEIENGVIEFKPHVVKYLTWSFFYGRFPRNKNYYGMKGVTYIDISNHLSAFVERSLSKQRRRWRCTGPLTFRDNCTTLLLTPWNRRVVFIVYIR